MRAVRLAFLAAALGMALAAAAMSHDHGAAPVASVADTQLQQAADLVTDAMRGHRVVLLGEMHGTRETPALAGAVLDRHAAQRRPVVLALEIGVDEQPRFDRYLASHGTQADRAALLAGAHWREAHHDGRDSQAMCALIEHVRRLHARGAPVALVAFDAGGPDMAARDRRMADALRLAATRHPSATLLVLTGNVHAMTRSPPWEMFDEGKRITLPMTTGRYLADLGPLSIDVRGARGASWVCTDRGCAVTAIPAPPVGTRPLSAPRLDRNAADDAWDDTLTLPRLTPSPPAVSVEVAGAAAGGRAERP